MESSVAKEHLSWDGVWPTSGRRKSGESGSGPNGQPFDVSKVLSSSNLVSIFFNLSMIKQSPGFRPDRLPSFSEASVSVDVWVWITAVFVMFGSVISVERRKESLI